MTNALQAVPQVSVVVPARNGMRDLTALITALERQTLPRESFEVIVADDGSTDDPQRLATDDGWIRVVLGPPTTSYAARNRGLAAARAPVIAFSDADCVPEPEWLAEGLAALAQADVVAGRIRFLAPERRSTWAFIDMETSKNQERLVQLGLAETANLFVRRALLDELHGFDGSIASNGDYDFVERCVGRGARLAFSSRARVAHPVRQTRAAVLRAHWIYCTSYAERAARDGKRVEGLKFRNWVPVAGVVRSRVRHGISVLGPDEEWLAANGVRLSTWERVRALPVIYLVLPYWRNTAQLAGWWRGRQRRSLSARRRVGRRGTP